jgi:hypothetical protein
MMKHEPVNTPQSRPDVVADIPNVETPTYEKADLLRASAH